MTHPLQIRRPELKDARTLGPMELNAIKFTDRHTLLTPGLLEKMRPAQPEVTPAANTHVRDPNSKL